MSEHTATLDKIVSAPSIKGPAPKFHPRGAVMKFAYPCGSRPLAGYTIKRGIGVGGFGEVYFATSDAGKEVALKRIQRNMDVELRGVRQCLNLKHANLIALWDIQHDDQREPWVVMEYVCGERVEDVIDRHSGGMPIDDVHAWFRGIAAGVTYLHDHGIVHRDLKPGNIFEDDDVVKIGDYGLSKFIASSQRSGQTESVGTFHYMAPEIGRGSYGKEIDIYALGVILCEMLTGRVPFDGESSQEIMMKHLTADPDVDDVAQPYRRVIQKALAKDPDRRYASVNAMLVDLGLDNSAAPKHESADETSSIPPVQPLIITDEANDTLYITDDANHDEIVMGDVKHIVDAEPIRETPGRADPRTKKMTNEASVPVARNAVSAAAPVHGWGRLQNWWNNAGLSAPVKVALAVAAAILLIVNAQWLIPACVVVGCGYLCFHVGRLVFRRLSDANSRREIKLAAVREISPAGDTRIRRSPRQILQLALNQRTAGERLSELTGSFLMSAFTSGVLCLVMVVIEGSKSFDSIRTWSLYAWLTLTCVAGTWLVLSCGKFFETQRSEPVTRRFVMLVAGLALGAASFACSTLLAIPVEFEQPRPFAELYSLPPSMVSGSHVLLPAYLAFFGGIFLVLGWWKQTDPLRRSRLSLWATAACVLWALVIDVFPLPWGFMLAACISVAVQLSAPWLSPRQRFDVQVRFQES